MAHSVCLAIEVIIFIRLFPKKHTCSVSPAAEHGKLPEPSFIDFVLIIIRDNTKFINSLPVCLHNTRNIINPLHPSLYLKAVYPRLSKQWQMFYHAEVL